MLDAHTFLQDLTLVFCVATCATLLFQRLRQPVVLGYLLAGLVVGPHLPLPIYLDHDSVELLSELGVILVVFSIGLEFRFERLVQVLPTSGIVGAIQVPAMIWLGYSAGQLAGWSGRESLFLGGTICISSTMIAARSLAARGEGARLTESVLGILVVQDLAAIILISVFTTIATGAGMPLTDVLQIVAELALFLLTAIAAGILIVPRLIREASRHQRAEVLLVAAIGTCFGLSLVAESLGYSVALGAFIAGSLVAESGRRHQVATLIEPVRDLFAAVFFVSIGMLVDPRALAENAAMIAIVSALVVLGQSFFVAVGSFLSGRDIELSIRSGLSLAQIGEFSFIIVGVGVSANALPERMMAITVGVAVVTTFLTPLAMGASQRVAVTLESHLPRPLQTFTALYGAWIESLQKPNQRRRGLRRSVILLLLNVLAIAAITAALDLGSAPISETLSQRTGLRRAAVGLVTVALATAAALPFVIGLARSVHAIARSLTSSVLPASQTGVDLADAPRRALMVSLQVAVALLALLPLLVLTQPFLPLYVGALVLALLSLVLGWLFWRSATNLQGHVRAGAEIVLEILDQQRSSDAHHAPAVAMDTFLPGLGPLVSMRVEEGTPAVGSSLAELNIRALAGATVVAMRHASGEGIGTPTGGERLRAGDELTLTGSTEAIERALRLLRGQPLDPL